MAITASDIAALSRLLDEALELDVGARERWIAALPETDGHLIPMLSEMLADHDRAGTTDFLSSIPGLRDAGRDDAVALPGELVGPYRLIREIGQGGMGAVWLAERADGSFKRQVALKLPLLAWGAGLAERMAREREIGALLEHPNIARLYDAGVDERGRPYLALEYIEGKPIDAWCNERALSARERLKLITQVVRAVAYAHGRLVVHRDLKPSNVLVTADGQTHLLDFGIAKLLREAAPGEVGLTQELGRVLTPHYASPEQLRGEAITVQSDVYSLGVLLYELLTGYTPYVPRRRTLAALEEAILEGEPPLASSRAEDKATARMLRGEVDAILAKALRREPALRYATADALAHDIERYLAGERVLAQPDSPWYRLRKAARRHRTGFVAAGAVLLAVALGAAASVVQARRANQEAERTRIVKDFVIDVFKINARDDPAKNELRQLPAELLLERGARLIEPKFAGQPQLQAELYGVIGGIFADMASPKLAAQYATKQVEALTTQGASAREIASALILLAGALGDEDHLADAEARARRALALSQGDSDLQAKAQLVVTRILLEKSDYAEAGKVLDAVESELAVARSSPSTTAADAVAMRAQRLGEQDRFDEAAPLYENAIEIALTVEGPLSRRAIRTRVQFVRALTSRNRPIEARRHFDAALAAMRALGGPDDVGAAVVQANAVGLMYDEDQMPASEALALATQSQQTLARLGPALPDGVRARVDRDLGWIYLQNGNIERGYALLTKAIPVLRVTAESPFERRVLAGLLGMANREVGRHAEADTLLHEALEMRKIDAAGSPSLIADGYGMVATNLRMQGRLEEAEAMLQAAPQPPRDGRPPSDIEISRVWIDLERGIAAPALALLARIPEDERNRRLRLWLKAQALCIGNTASEGWPLIEEEMRNFAADRYEFSPGLARLRAQAGLCALGAGQPQRAADLARLAREAFTRQPNVSPYYKVPLLKLEERLRKR